MKYINFVIVVGIWNGRDKYKNNVRNEKECRYKSDDWCVIDISI